ncbi:MAG: zinc metallopeptidase [Lachnospiraceae bacterium]|nr:zinc metallopeptidase [Lachnospiraceae bacterium]
MGFGILEYGILAYTRYGSYNRIGFDPSYILVLIGMVLSLAASAYVKSTFKKYSRVMCSRNITGKDVAERILNSQGIYDVSVHHISGDLTDHYHPTDKTVNLSDSVYGRNSVASIAVAAHECGHAVQHNVGYQPIKWRTAVLPAANIGSKLSWVFIAVGLIFYGSMSMFLIKLGIVAFSFAVLFQVVTLPVEFNASSRALKILKNDGILSNDETKMAAKVLRAAALTYVASAATGFLQLARLVMIANRRR